MFRFLFAQEINCMNLNMFVSFLSKMLEGQLILFFSLFLDDGGDSAYDGKEELQRLDILSMESIHSEAQSNVVDDSDDDSDDDVHS